MIRNFTKTSPQQLGGLKSLAVAGLLLAAITGNAQTTFNYTGAMQTYTVPPGVTLIHIDAQGAQGGNVTVACAATGGLGARMQGDVTVTPGEILSVLVGGQGQTNGEDGGGGGGSFVVRTGNVPLVVAGGGGGASNNIQICTGNRNGVNASITTSGTASANGLVAGGSPGNGGGANVGSGGGGGGFNTDGVGGSGNVNGRGRAYINGGAGGTGIASDHGGYGGGGCGWFYGGNGGGGGGYAGGGTDGNYPSTYFGGGGGGGSYNSGTNQVNTAGYRSGNGLVVITPLVVYNASITQNATIQCFGQSTASLTATVTGGTSPFTYAWAPSGGTAATATGLGAGTYTVTVTDAASAVTTQTFTVTQPAALVASPSSQTDISCFGGSNGSAVVTATGGTGAYSYSWSPSGGTAATASSLIAGGYTVTVTDANSCSTTQTFNITEPSAALAATTMQTNVTCNGGNNGDAMVMPTGGTPGYSYNWQPSGGSLSSASGLSIGTYTCTITDANGCSTTQSVTITEPPALAATATAVNALCNGGSDGSASVTATGGTPAYTYSWAPSGGTAATATGLTAGTYTCTITDANNCSMTQTVLVSEPDPLAVTPTSTSALCNGNANGSATVSVFGGTSPYTYSWAPAGGTNATATGLAAGTYTCTITDVNSCATTQTVQVTEPATLAGVITTVINPVFCNGTNGSIDLSVNGGTPNYTYAWSNSATTQDVNGLTAGTYSVVITDANNCTTTQTVTLVDPNPPTVTLSLPVATVCAADGATVLSGGTPAGGTYSGPGVSGTLFTPANASIGMNTITYTYTDLNTGCSGTNTDVIFVDACIGIIESANSSSFIVFPNPNNGSFTLQLKTTDAADVLIYDALGKLISSTKVKPDVQQQLQLNEAGMYLVTVITADGARSTQRVTVTK
jgi:hypothetical protein